ncbi:NAD(P)/FAD-dependent oxidoreductase [Aliterella atlantica]|uniref:FAD-dependent oxidoreductase n=1 Tax=Aliterella atlantica CENA595 TaxID=1618023 RepID=A0A0D8ZPK7_9CYAN|nr:FAD-dependent oxidoreductase [Aliterella atlantica]KJH70728.1 FAD-dependent oxidoreductase [Aliterella atlantica CENA595]
MSNVVIIGCGIVGAAIAYELSQVPGLNITVIDRQAPAQGSTGAALGVLMGAISHKIKGRAWQMRSSSIQRYQSLIPELEALTGRKIPCNRQGIVMLCSKEEDLSKWENLVRIRASQGWQLEIWDKATLQSHCPQLDCQNIPAAVYSPQDLQVDPVALTLALVDAAKQRGVAFHFGANVSNYKLKTPSSVEQVQISGSNGHSLAVDWLVVAAGLGSLQALPSRLQPPKLDVRPVLGQAIQIRLPDSLGDRNFQPVITGNDVHIVPCVTRNMPITDYWIGATVEFSQGQADIVADAVKLEEVRQSAIAFCPDLAAGNIIKAWSGLRPRPEARPAPIIEPLTGFSNVLLATGHYRNGVLLAPATAQTIRQMILPS